jgi:hypothetical protein
MVSRLDSALNLDDALATWRSRNTEVRIFTGALKLANSQSVP